MPDIEETKEIFERLRAIEGFVARIDERLARMDRDYQAAQNTHEKLSGRITDLEQLRARVGGISFAIGTAVSIISAGIAWLIQCALQKGAN